MDSWLLLGNLVYVSRVGQEHQLSYLKMTSHGFPQRIACAKGEGHYQQFAAVWHSAARGRVTMQFPDYVQYAAQRVLNMDKPGFADHWLETFAEECGGFDEMSLLRTLADGQQQSATRTLFALYALGRLGTLPARDTLASCLTSDEVLERWASALGLGALRDERAVTVLYQMLIEYRPISFQPSSGRVGLHSNWPYTVPRLLADWGNQQAIPSLVKGLRYAIGGEIQCRQAIEELEQQEVPTDSVAPDPFTVRRLRGEERYWKDYQSEIIYALGRLKAWSGLKDLTGVEDERTKLWRIHLIMGALTQQARVNGKEPLWKKNPDLLAAVRHELVHRFGANLNDYEPALRAYDVYRLPPLRRIDLE